MVGVGASPSKGEAPGSIPSMADPERAGRLSSGAFQKMLFEKG